MTWFDRLEEKRTLLISGLITICFTTLMVVARRDPVAFDSFWHLQTGLDWIQNGLDPWVDHYSFTFAGKTIHGQPVFFQAMLAWLVESLGLEHGFQVLKLAAFLLVLGLMAAFLRKLRSPAVIYLVVLPLLTLLIELRATVRPELFSYSLSIIALMLYHRARGRSTFANVLPMALLMFVWSNYHTSTLGYILLFGFFVDAAVLQLREKTNIKEWIRWLIGGLIVLGAGTLNKGLHLPVISSITFSPEFESFIQEYRSAALYKEVIGVYALFAIALTVSVLSIKKAKFGYLIVTLIFSYYSIRMSRLVAPTGVIMLGMLVSLASEFDLKSAISNQGKTIRRLTVVAVSLVSLLPLYSSVSLARGFMIENRTSALIRPESIVTYIKDQQFEGRVLNEYGIGGYLIHELTPGFTVYIDGRTGILYPPRHVKLYQDVRINPEVALEEIDSYGIEFALLDADQRTFSVMHEVGRLGLDFADHKFALFTSESPNFPLTGKLLGAPACWSESDQPQLQKEFVDSLMILPGNSLLLPLLGFMHEYAGRYDRTTFLEQFAASGAGNEMQIRFAAYQALSFGLLDTAVQLFESIEIWEHREFLAAAMAYVKKGNYTKAEEVIDEMTIVLWPHVTTQDTVLLYRILQKVREESSLTVIPENFIQDLEERINLESEHDVIPGLDYSLLCPASLPENKIN